MESAFHQTATSEDRICGNDGHERCILSYPSTLGLEKMPCWYYDKQELRETASARDGIDFDTETRYRREGARFIIDAGTKMCLRHDTCASGVVYFHRFYMFHSFREFHRHVVAACCLFLAGKVEETPKKCKDLIRTCRSQLTEQQFQVFGEDPKEEVMTLERILLQTIKFDLQLEHPYAYLLKYAKRLQGPDLSKADKNKIQKVVQMAWTFINDSLCTRLPLQWEPDIIAVALMYLASRLSKFEITDWQGKPPGFRGKWYEYLVEDVTLDLLEDICHQVLDLYSPSNAGRDESPPPPPPPPRAVQGQQAAVRRSRPATPSDASRPDPAAKRSRQDPTRSRSKSTSPGPQRDDAKRPDKAKLPVGAPGKPIPNMAQFSNAAVQPGSKHSSPAAMALPGAAGLPPPASGGAATASGQFTNYNPYVSQNKYSASFLTHEGLASIQNLLGNNSGRGQGSRGYPTSQPPRPRGHTPATRPGNAPRGPYPPSTQPPPPQQSGYQQSYRQPPQPPAPGNHSNPQGFQQPPPQPPPSTNSNPPGYQQPPPQPPPGNPPQYQQPPPPPQPGFQQQPQQQQQPARYPPPSGYNPQAQYNQTSYNQSGPSGGFHGPQGGQNHQQQQQQQQSYPQNYQPQNQQAHPNYNPQQQQQQQPQNQYNMNQYGNTQMYPQQQQQQQQQGQYHGYNNQVPPDGNYQNYPPTGGFNRPPGPPGQNMYPGPGGPPSVRITPRR